MPVTSRGKLRGHSASFVSSATPVKHPEQCALVFKDLEPAIGAWALLTVTTFLDRLEVLEKGEGRKGTRKGDLAALATLEQRGITQDERTRLRGLIQTAKKSSPAPAPGPQQAHEQQEVERIAALKQARAWYDDWADVARAVIKRRDYLIRLGLAKRKAPKKKAPPAVVPGI